MKERLMSFIEKLSRDEMRTITGGYDDAAACSVACDQNNIDERETVTDCNRTTVEAECGSAENAVCSCTV